MKIKARKYIFRRAAEILAEEHTWITYSCVALGWAVKRVLREEGLLENLDAIEDVYRNTYRAVAEADARIKDLPECDRLLYAIETDGNARQRRVMLLLFVGEFLHNRVIGEITDAPKNPIS